MIFPASPGGFGTVDQFVGKGLIINGAPKKSVKNGPEMDRKLVDGWELVVDSRNEVWLNRRQQKEESTLI